MSETYMGVIKPETSDGSIQQVEHRIAIFCPLIEQEIIQKGTGSSKNCAISLPKEVSPATLSLILDYCRFYEQAGRSDKEKKSYDDQFIKGMDTDQRVRLLSAANILQLKSLVDLISCAIARGMVGKSADDMREMFHLPDDLTEEEKLEPVKNITGDISIRLLNRLNAKKLKELKEGKSKKVEVKDEHADQRSVDELMSYIEGKDGDEKGIKTSKKKKKNRRNKEQQKFSSLEEAKTSSAEPNKKEVNGHDIERQNAEADRFARNSNSPTEDDVSAHKEIDEEDMDDEFDPALKEKIDRSVYRDKYYPSNWINMSETYMGVIKPEPYIWLQTSDGSIQQVEHKIAIFCPLIEQEIIQKGTGSSKNCAISLPKEVSPAMLSLILDYCCFYERAGRTKKEMKSYDDQFIKGMDTDQLFELLSSANILQLKSLVDLISSAIARGMVGKSADDMREMFHLPDDLTEEEKLEPLKNPTANVRIRLLNSLNARKLKELKERKSKKVEVKDEHEDQRSVRRNGVFYRRKGWRSKGDQNL